MARKNVIAPSDEKAVVAMDKMEKNIEEANRLYGDGEPFEEERVLDEIVYRAGRASYEVEFLGKYCLWYRRVCGHGKFLEGLNRRDIDIKAAYWAMKQVEVFGAEFHTVRNLGARKARMLTVFTKEEINAYAEGGPLGDIPHDAVSDMTTQELEKEVRKLRKKFKEEIKSREDVIDQKEKKINELEKDLRYFPKPTKEQLAQARLDPLKKTLFGHLLQAQFYLDEAVNVVAAAQAVEGATFPQLQEWAKTHYEQLSPIGDLFEELDQALNNCGPDKKS